MPSKSRPSPICPGMFPGRSLPVGASAEWPCPVASAPFEPRWWTPTNRSANTFAPLDAFEAPPLP